MFHIIRRAAFFVAGAVDLLAHRVHQQDGGKIFHFEFLRELIVLFLFLGRKLLLVGKVQFQHDQVLLRMINGLSLCHASVMK